jgi:ADP-ribose pyrophosphatase YjhB (NUDIX family)
LALWLEIAAVLTRVRSLISRRADLVTLGVQAAILDDSRVLLVRHTYRPGWHFPGGGVERGEKLESAVAREVFEETGIVLAGPVRLFGIYSHFDAYPGDHVVLFLVDSWRRERVPEPNSEIAEHGFFARDQLPSSMSPGTSRRLRELFGGIDQSDTW